MVLKQIKPEPKSIDKLVPKKTSEQVTVTFIGDRAQLFESFDELGFPEKYQTIDLSSTSAYVSGDENSLSCFVQVEDPSKSGLGIHYDWYKFDLSYTKLAGFLKTYRMKGEDQLIKDLANGGMGVCAAGSLSRTLARLDGARFTVLEVNQLDKKHIQTQLNGSSLQFKKMFGRKSMAEYYDDLILER